MSTSHTSQSPVRFSLAATFFAVLSVAFLGQVSTMDGGTRIQALTAAVMKFDAPTYLPSAAVVPTGSVQSDAGIFRMTPPVMAVPDAAVDAMDLQSATNIGTIQPSGGMQVQTQVVPLAPGFASDGASMDRMGTADLTNEPMHMTADEAEKGIFGRAFDFIANSAAAAAGALFGLFSSN